jgi:hypothetical protein
VIDDDDELLGFDDNGDPRPMTLANAIQVYSLRVKAQPVTVGDCAMIFNVSEDEVRRAVEMHPWMFITGANNEFVEHEGE